ncbi:MAG: hypothetical protein H7268_15880 [Sandarakinorhabdus sp.]|nr:hypothetical protein [Sandarakinorhabdus sp.]
MHEFPVKGKKLPAARDKTEQCCSIGLGRLVAIQGWRSNWALGGLISPTRSSAGLHPMNPCQRYEEGDLAPSRDAGTKSGEIAARNDDKLTIHCILDVSLFFAAV